MSRICKTCSEDRVLKNIIKKKGVKGTCSLCGKKSKRVIDTSEDIFIKTIACLIRYYFSEWEYHSKLGGVGFDRLLSKDNSIFNYPKKVDEEIIDDFLMSFVDDLYENKDISLITAYGRDIYNHFPQNAVSVGSQDLLFLISKELEKQNYFLVEPKFEPHFKKIKEYVAQHISSGEVFFRARIGATKSASDYIFEKSSTKDYFTPYQNEEIGAPPILIASAGRVNRPGVSYLYLASDINTAISEIRPHPGEKVSLGEFIAKNDLTIADVSTHHLIEKLMSDEGLESLALIIGIEKTLSTATPPGNSTFYGITQFITEMIRKLGFDGICFRSSVGSGKNLVVFDPNNFEWRPSSGNVYSIEKVTYSYEHCELFDEKGNYDRVL